MALAQGRGAHLPAARQPRRPQASLGNQALILQARGELDGAMALHKEAGAHLPAARQPRRPPEKPRQPGGHPLRPRPARRGHGPAQGRGAHLPAARQPERAGDIPRQPGQASRRNAVTARSHRASRAGPRNRAIARPGSFGTADTTHPRRHPQPGLRPTAVMDVELAARWSPARVRMWTPRASCSRGASPAHSLPCSPGARPVPGRRVGDVGVNVGDNSEAHVAEPVELEI